MKKEKAFWIWADGFAYDHAKSLIDNTQEDSVYFRVTPPE